MLMMGEGWAESPLNPHRLAARL
uniref:Uncharacterized protein n=1 Tax=Anguilla anguilla TaxID=7936 RepID=A0A0E9RC02_ANGAN